MPDVMTTVLSAIPFFVAGLIWLAVWIFGIIIAWRWMRAHESIAASLRAIADSWQTGPRGRGAD